MKAFFIKLFLFSLIVSALDFCWIRFAPVGKHVPHVWPMLLFFIVVTSIFHFVSIYSSKGKPQAFIRFYMGSTAFRLFLYVMVIVAYRFFDKSTIVPFALGFMLHYFLFTAFEVPVLLKELKKS